MKRFTYETCCIHSDGESINAMRDHPSCREVTYATMLRRCEGLLEWADEHCYERRGLSLRADWHVSYHRSVYRGRSCYYLVWSAIEFIWTEVQ